MFAGAECPSRGGEPADEPDLCIAGLAVWVEARSCPDSDDFWDGNWLVVRARVEAAGAWVAIEGSYLRSDEIQRFLRELERVDADLEGAARLETLEQMLRVEMRCGALGQVEAVVEITPDRQAQAHRFVFDLDQSYLRSVLSGCRRILAAFPVRGGVV